MTENYALFISAQNKVVKRIFKQSLELEQHLLTGKHTVPCKVSIMDQVKESFIHRRKGNSSLASLNNLDDIQATSARNNSETTMQYFSTMGWALPVKENKTFSKAKNNVWTVHARRGVRKEG